MPPVRLSNLEILRTGLPGWFGSSIKRGGRSSGLTKRQVVRGPTALRAVRGQDHRLRFRTWRAPGVGGDQYRRPGAAAAAHRAPAQRGRNRGCWSARQQTARSRPRSTNSARVSRVFAPPGRVPQGGRVGRRDQERHRAGSVAAVPGPREVPQSTVVAPSTIACLMVRPRGGPLRRVPDSDVGPVPPTAAGRTQSAAVAEGGAVPPSGSCAVIRRMSSSRSPGAGSPHSGW